MSPVVAADGVRAALDTGGRRGGAPVRVVAAVGPESFLREQVLRDVVATVLGDPDSPDVVVLTGAPTSSDADEETLARFFDETRTGSLFGSRKVVVLRHADALVGRHKKAFGDWFENPGSAAVAVLLAEELPAALEKAAEAAGLVVRCGGRGTRGESPLAFASRRAAARGKRLGRNEAELLVELLGADLTGLENAVEVLSLHAGEAEVIGRDDVEALYQSSREGSVWAFGDRLVLGDVPGALAEASRCFNEGVPEYTGSRKVTRSETTVAVRLVSAFATAVCRVLEVRAQLDAGVPRQDVKLAGRVPWSAREVARDAATRRRPAAIEALAVFAEETDRAMKSGGAVGRAAVARLVAAVGRVP